MASTLKEWLIDQWDEQCPFCPHNREKEGNDGIGCIGVCLRRAWKGFLLGFGVRAGISLGVKLFSILRTRPNGWKSFNYDEIFGEKHLIFRVEAVRLGLFVGIYTGLYNAITCFLRRLRQKHDGINSAIGGLLAGPALFFQPKETRRTLALYVMARTVESCYYSAKQRGWWHFWGSDWAYGDVLLFALSTAQVQYAYVMRPETLPASYWKFIVRMGPIHPLILESTRRLNRGEMIDTAACLDYVKRYGREGTPILKNPPNILGCDYLHPQSKFCSTNVFRIWKDTYMKSFPMYLSLTLVPAVAFSFKKFFRNPASSIVRVLVSTAGSTAFLASFVGLYQAVCCFYRSGFGTDHRSVYWFSGLIAGLSLLLEQKSRRSEIALYVFPRAVDSFFLQLSDRKLLGQIRNGDVLLFSICMSLMMYFYEFEPGNVSRFIKFLFSRFFSSPVVEEIEGKPQKEDH